MVFLVFEGLHWGLRSYIGVRQITLEFEELYWGLRDYTGV